MSVKDLFASLFQPPLLPKPPVGPFKKWPPKVYAHDSGEPTEYTRVILRRGTTAEWREHDPVLEPNEIVFDTSTGLLYVGDGVTPWHGLEGR